MTKKNVRIKLKIEHCKRYFIIFSFREYFHIHFFFYKSEFLSGYFAKQINYFLENLTLYIFRFPEQVLRKGFKKTLGKNYFCLENDIF